MISKDLTKESATDKNNKFKVLTMVVLHVKKNDSLFLLETTLEASVNDTIQSILCIYNGCLKIERICSEIVDLACYGISLPQEMRGLLDEQIEELHLVDTQAEICTPSGGYDLMKDPYQRRNGQQPKDNMREVLNNSVKDAKEMISKENVKKNNSMTWEVIRSTLDLLQGAVSIVYPMGLPEYDPIRMEFENRENLVGSQASTDVLDGTQAVLWFSTKELCRGKHLKDYLGRNEKSKVIIKLSTKSQGQPVREPVFSEEDQKRMMLANHKRREELLALEKASDDSYLNSPWADPNTMKSKLTGMNNISWK